MDDPQVVHGVQGSGNTCQLPAGEIRRVKNNRWVGIGMGTSASLSVLGSLLRYCLRSRPTVYS